MVVLATTTEFSWVCCEEANESKFRSFFGDMDPLSRDVVTEEALDEFIGSSIQARYSSDGEVPPPPEEALLCLGKEEEERLIYSGEEEKLDNVDEWENDHDEGYILESISEEEFLEIEEVCL